MRRLAFSTALLFCGLAFAQQPAFTFAEERKLPVYLWNVGQGPQALFAGPSVSTVSADFCASFAGELTGNYFCLNGDATQRSSAAATLSPVGSPITESRPTCGAGPDCPSVTAQRLNGSSQYFTTANVVTGSVSFTACVMVTPDSRVNQQFLVAKYGGANARSWVLTVNAGVIGTNLSIRSDADAITSTSNGGSLIAGQRSLVCATYQPVADGTSVGTIYVNGVQVTSSSALGLANTTTNTPITVGSGNAGSLAFGGRIGPAFYTEKLVSPTTLQAMANVLLPKPFGSRGEAITVSRASALPCTAATGEITVLPVDYACMTKGGIEVWPGGAGEGDELLLDTEALDSASWSKIATPTITANAWDFGMGSATGEEIVDDDVANRERVEQTVTTSTSGSWTLSCFAQAGTTGTTRNFLTVNVDAAGGATPASTSCQWSDLSSTTSRKVCQFTLTGVVTSLLIKIAPGNGTADTGSVRVGGCNLKASSLVTPYTPRATAAAQRAAQITTIPTPPGFSSNEGCAKFAFTPLGWSTTHPTGGAILKINTGASQNSAIAYFTGGGSTVIRTSGNGGGNANLAAGYLDGSRKLYRSQWSLARSEVKMESSTLGTSTNGTGFPGFAAPGAVLYIGAHSDGTIAATGRIDSLVIGNNPDGCR